MSATVLITGGNGFTGNYLRALLQANNMKVVKIVRDKTRSPSEWHCDLLDKVAVKDAIAAIKPDYVIHLAAVSFVGHADEQSFYKVNIFGTLNLLEAISSANYAVKKIIVASTANIYGSPDVPVIDETITPSPVSHYAVSKMAMEYLVRTWFDRLPILITRPFNYTGVGQDERFLIPKIVHHFKRRAKHIELGNLIVARDFSDVRDVANAYLLLMQSAAISETFNICSGYSYSLQEIIRWMEEIADYEIEVRVNPQFVRKNEIPILLGSYDKLNRLTDYRPKYLLIDTLRAMFYA